MQSQPSRNPALEYARKRRKKGATWVTILQDVTIQRSAEAKTWSSDDYSAAWEILIRIVRAERAARTEERLAALTLVNPVHLELVSDGGGEYPDGYRLTERGIAEIRRILWEVMR